MVDLGGKLRTHSAVPVVKTAAQAAPHPALAGWLLGDEPDGSSHPVSPPEVRLARRKLADGPGGSLPMVIRLRADYPSSLYQYSDVADVLVVPFAVGGGRALNVKTMAARLDIVKKVRKGQGPFWAEFDVSNTRGAGLTARDISLPVYLAITHGADGLLWSPYGSLKAAPDAWKAVTDVAAEVRMLSPALFSPPIQLITAANKPGMHGTVRRYQDSVYLILLNGTGAEQAGAAFSLQDIPDGTDAEVLFEDRTLSVEDGKLTDDFRPYERHVYRIPPSTGPSSSE
jgi:hypothetical protein